MSFPGFVGVFHEEEQILDCKSCNCSFRVQTCSQMVLTSSATASATALEGKVPRLVWKSGCTYSCEGKVSQIPTYKCEEEDILTFQEVRLYLKLGSGRGWSPTGCDNPAPLQGRAITAELCSLTPLNGGSQQMSQLFLLSCSPKEAS